MSALRSDRLGAVSRVRKILERRALGELAEGRRALVDAEATVAEREAAHRQRPAGPPTVSALELRALQLQGLGSHELVEAATGARDVAEHRVEELWTAWSLASIQRKSVERLEERQAHEQATAAEQATARALDEMVLQRRGRS